MPPEQQDLNDEQQQFEDDISAGFNASASETAQRPPEEERKEEPDWRAVAEQAKADAEKAQQRFLSLQSKYNSEVPALHDQLREIKNRIDAPVAATAAHSDAIEVFRNDYPAIAEAVEAMQARAMAPLQEQTRAIESAVTTVVANETRTAEQMHFDAIYRADKNWETKISSPAFDAWVNEQPSFARDGIQRVLDKGNAGEVIELLNNFKGPKPASARNDPPVTSSRSRQIPVGLAGEPDKNDLTAGFRMAMNSQ